MLFKARRMLGRVLVISLLIQIQIAANAYAVRGTKIAFTCWKDGNHEICVMDGDGGNEVRLTDNPDRDYQPSWSPDGTRIAFTRGHHLYVMDPDGQNLMELTKNTSGWKAAWSPDGRWIVYDSHRDWAFQIYVVETDGGGFTRRVSRDPPNNSNPAWSPDGNTIAYVAWGLVNSTINLMTPDGKHLEQLTEDGFYSADPDWFAPSGWSVSPAASFVTVWGEIKVPKSGR